MSLRTQKRKISPNSENRSSSRSSLIVNSQDGRAQRQLAVGVPSDGGVRRVGAPGKDRDQLTCAHVLPVTAAQADTSLMPNSAASCR